jgi:hypothetical protein
MSVNVILETDQSNLPLLGNKSENYKMFEIVFTNGTYFIDAHSHVVFPKCGTLSSFEFVDGNYIFNLAPEPFENFIRLLYGGNISLTVAKLYELYKMCKFLSYDKLDLLHNLIMENIDKIPYSETDYQLDIILSLIEDPSFDKSVILNRCKFSQLKRLKDKIDDISTLREIIDIMTVKYTVSTKELKTYYETKILEKIGFYETKIAQMKIQKTASNSSSVNEPKWTPPDQSYVEKVKREDAERADTLNNFFKPKI